MVPDWRPPDQPYPLQHMCNLKYQELPRYCCIRFGLGLIYILYPLKMHIHLNLVVSCICLRYIVVFGTFMWKIYFDGLVQECSISIANALEILQSCPKPSILSFTGGSELIIPVAMNLQSAATPKKSIPYLATLENMGKIYHICWNQDILEECLGHISRINGILPIKIPWKISLTYPIFKQLIVRELCKIMIIILSHLWTL